MRVKIIRESVDHKWYDVHVGESFEIDERKTTDQFYIVKETFLRWIRPIYKSDCVILSENETEGGSGLVDRKPHCQCLYEIENKLPRTKFCVMACRDQFEILRQREKK